MCPKQSQMTTATVNTNLGYSGSYLKSDRKSIYPIGVRSSKDNKVYWLKPEDISSVNLKNSTITGEKFCSLLQIKN